MPNQENRLEMFTIVKHFKGGIYMILGHSKNSETLEETVIYQSLETGQIWNRPIDMFYGTTSTGVQRFTVCTKIPVMIVHKDFILNKLYALGARNVQIHEIQNELKKMHRIQKLVSVLKNGQVLFLKEANGFDFDIFEITYKFYCGDGVFNGIELGAGSNPQPKWYNLSDMYLAISDEKISSKSLNCMSDDEFQQAIEYYRNKIHKTNG